MSVFGRHADKNATNYLTTTSVKFTGPENAGVEYPPVLWFRALVLFRSMMSSCSAGRQLLLTLNKVTSLFKKAAIKRIELFSHERSDSL